MLKHPTLVLITLMLGTSMAAIDSSIVNVSLPVIRHQFNANVDEIEWIITAYMITFTLCIPLITWLKNRIGYFNLYIISVAIFTTGSLLCSLSHSLVLLVAARVIQAIGGGAITPTSLAILSESFPPEKRGSAIGWWGLGNVMGPALGPTLGGILTHYFGWESVFYVNIPLGILTILLTFRYLSFLRDRLMTKPLFDFRGFTWFALFIVAVQYTVSAISKKGQLPEMIAGCTCFVLFLYLFIRSARTTKTSSNPGPALSLQPLLDLTVFNSPDFVHSAIIVVIRSVALFGGLFFLPFLLQGLLGYTTIQSGLLMLPNALMMLVARPYAGKKADQGLIRSISLLGILLLALSMYLLSRIDLGTTVLMIILPMIVRGLGISFLVAPVSTALLNAVSREQIATATSMNSLLQQLGGSIGIAIFGVLHQFIYAHYLNKGYQAPLAEHFALQDGFFVAAAVVALALIPAIRLPQRHVVKVKENSPV
ncbi:MAG TPA: DHA2 family efflux MFS transporter permease subunit [Puia sp.]|jgi:DHA2 family multidrug resistance protein|nr:DHA2 family efflux MFS transporter permease subunit [Puia sp.]